MIYLNREELMSKTMLLVVLTLALSITVSADDASLHVTEVQQGDYVIAGGNVIEQLPVRFIIHQVAPGDASTLGQTNGFEVYTYRNGVMTDNFEPATAGLLTDVASLYYDGGFFLGTFSGDGRGADTLKFGGFGISKSVPPGAEFDLGYVETGSLVSGDTICIDSSFYRPSNTWLWSTSIGDVSPSWNGPLHYPVVPCCAYAGDLDFDGQWNITDLITLAEYIFPPHNPILCDGAGDANASGEVNVSDLTYLVSFLFRDGSAPLPCQ